MTNSSFLDNFWQGYNVESFVIDDSNDVINISLVPTNELTLVCSCCRTPCHSIHDTAIRTVRDSSCFEYKTFISLPIRRVLCSKCGPKREYISWLPNNSRLTNRFIFYIESLCRALPISHIAELLGLHWETVRNIDKRRLQREVLPVDYSGVTQLVMDEFALHKGHRYATVIADAHTLKVLWVGEGNSRESIRPFFEELGEFCDNIKAVAMDMNTSFDLEVKAHCSNAEVVYDLFHVVAKYGREVIDRVRVDRANELIENKKERKAVKRGRWLLLKNENNLTEKQAESLKELLDANLPLSIVYLLKEELKEIWRARSVWKAFRRWKSWFRKVKESDIQPLRSFARKLKPYFRGIISSARYPLRTSCLEGINNKIKVIKRMAYGYRDNDYFFLKIKAAFPGKT